jgi:hypothetical protein
LLCETYVNGSRRKFFAKKVRAAFLLASAPRATTIPRVPVNVRSRDQQRHDRTPMV